MMMSCRSSVARLPFYDGEFEERNLLQHQGNVGSPTLLQSSPCIQNHIYEYIAYRLNGYASISEPLTKYLYLLVGK